MVYYKPHKHSNYPEEFISNSHAAVSWCGGHYMIEKESGSKCATVITLSWEVDIMSMPIFKPYYESSVRGLCNHFTPKK